MPHAQSTDKTPHVCKPFMSKARAVDRLTGVSRAPVLLLQPVFSWNCAGEARHPANIVLCPSLRCFDKLDWGFDLLIASARVIVTPPLLLANYGA